MQPDSVPWVSAVSVPCRGMSFHPDLKCGAEALRTPSADHTVLYECRILFSIPGSSVARPHLMFQRTARRTAGWTTTPAEGWDVAHRGRFRRTVRPSGSAAYASCRAVPMPIPNRLRCGACAGMGTPRTAAGDGKASGTVRICRFRLLPPGRWRGGTGATSPHGATRRFSRGERDSAASPGRREHSPSGAHERCSACVDPRQQRSDVGAAMT
jgi:hypothetical protein